MSELHRLNLSDVGNAERFARMHMHQFRYVTDISWWLKWTGSRWHRVQGKGELRRAAKKVTQEIYSEAGSILSETERHNLARHALRSESKQRIDAMIELASAEEEFSVTTHELDAKPFLLSCGNGTLDLRTSELNPANPFDLLTRGTNVEFDSTARAPQWERFLLEIFDGQFELVTFLQRAVGYTLTGCVDGQCFFLLHGDGCNGKSVFLNCLSALLGECGMTAPFDTFVKKNNSSSIPNDIASMMGARLVIASEGEADAQFAEARLKTLTGGDEVAARFLHGEYFNFHPILKLWLATNHKPSIQGTGSAIWRRMRLVPFDVSFLGRENPALQGQLMAELPGILAWAVQGCRDWLADGGGPAGLDVSPLVRNATETYRNDSDVLRQFIAESAILDKDAKTATSELYKAYCSWCEDSEHQLMTLRLFGRKLTERGLKSKSSNGVRARSGIQLRNGVQRKHVD